MATMLWGKVYYQNLFAGILRQEPGGRCAFDYDPDYLASDSPAIAYTLPFHDGSHYSEAGLHPFFDNLVAEGWLRSTQARALGIPPENRFALLLAFGRDCAGAVSVIDPEPIKNLRLNQDDRESIAALTSRASLSGIQPKLMVVKDSRGYRPAREGEISTHLAKLPSGQLPDIIELEWLTTLAVENIQKRLEPAQTAIHDSNVGNSHIRDGIINLMEKRWKGTFASIGQFLSKKRGGGGKSKGFLNNGSPQ